jgi:ABC-2 type transport system ATP-binding protein
LPSGTRPHGCQRSRGSGSTRLALRATLGAGEAALIEVDRLECTFGDLVAVAGVSFSVGAGEIFGFLGPNGAGKSTTIKMLSTLLRPTGGRASVAGHDVVHDPAAVRRALGILFQDSALDDRLTARENLRVHCAIYGVPRRERAARIDELLDWIELAPRADDLVRTFSGGMRRRLEVARALLHRPRVLFLDEPTTGLDPQTRRALWDTLHALRAETKLTIFMTTHYMEEAERCDRVAIIDHGALVAEGTPAELRQRAGHERVVVTTADDARAAAELRVRFGVAPEPTLEGLEFQVPDGAAFLPRLSGFPIEIRSLLLRKPTLEDAFLALTGRAIRPEEAEARDVLRAMVRKRGRLRG